MIDFRPRLNYTGLFKKRPNDILGLAFAHCSINNTVKNIYGYLGHESVFEFTYLARLSPHIEIQPDIQYVVHPGAVYNVKNSLAGMLVFYLNF